MRNKNVKMGGRKHSLLGEKMTSIIDYEAYTYYLQNSEIVNRQDIKHYVEHGKVLSEFYRIIGEKITESEGGVFIDGLGYFGVVQANKGLYKENPIGTKKINTSTDGIIYKLAFVPIGKNNNLKPWTFDGSFIKGIKQKLKVALKAGKKYNFTPSLFFNRLRQRSNDL